MEQRCHRALVVHPDRTTRQCWADQLRARSLDVSAVPAWPDALPQLQQPGLDVVVLSLRPEAAAPVGPKLEHWCSARRMAPIIAVTRPGDVQATRAALRAGVSDCLAEPVSDVDWEESVLAVLNQPLAPAVQAGATNTPPSEGLQALMSHGLLLSRVAQLRTVCRRYRQTLAVMVLDLDRFRECNERYSSEFGDSVLEWFASVLLKVSRGSDLVSRYEADSFIVVLPCAQEADARDWADRVRKQMVTEPLLHCGEPYEVFVSLGIVESSARFLETEHQLIRRARIALEHVKRGGGNRSASWSEVVGQSPTGQDLRQLSSSGVSHWITRVREQLRCTYLESTQALVGAVEAKNPYTRDHSLNVATYAETLARRLRLPAALVEALRVAGLLHDLGKIGVPDAVLNKPGPFTRQEAALVQRHPRTALEILGHVSFLTQELPIILHHHERYDGAGYPEGLRGEQIPVGARVLAVADAIDAMFSGRCYKPAYTKERVQAELQKGAGTQFDPLVAQTALEWLEETPSDAVLQA